jgi:6-phosphofructokinase 1
MNAAIRAIVRLSSLKGFQILGFERGWKGLITNSYRELTPRSVGGILQLGGTILYTSRCREFRKKEGVRKAAETLAQNHIDGLIVIGGNGSFKGAHALSMETDTLIVGIPATIDNDVFGTEETIGFDTAVNTAVTEVDKIRDTARAAERTFLVEVMGRERGFLALTVGLTVGAEIILVPEVKYEREKIIETLKVNAAKGKRSSIIIVAEGVKGIRRLAKEIEKKARSEVRISVLGYSQRGGSPTARSRFLANLFASKAVELLAAEQGNRVVGLQKGAITSVELEKSSKTEKALDLHLFKLAEMLAT